MYLRTLLGTAVAFVLLTAFVAMRNGAPPAQQVARDVEIYAARLQPVNPTLTDREVDGVAIIVVRGDSATIAVEAEGLQPGMMHLQHYHGFTDGEDATCAPPEADTNNDGVVDLIETREYSGITLVPFHENPTSLQIKSDTYPVAEGDDGRIQYLETISLDELRSALERSKDIDDLSFEDRVVYLHGVDQETELPASVQSLGEVPAHVTLPVACGEIRQIG